MTECCSNTANEIEKLREKQSQTLKVVLSINFGMFLVEFISGLTLASMALLGDSLDMLGDAMVYAFSLYVVSRNDQWKAASAMLKSCIMGFFGLFVLGYAIYKFVNPVTPPFEAIGLIGLIALLANTVCLSLLWKHRTEDINMKSVWLCSRNDIIANILVLCSSIGVWFFDSQWPDLIVGIIIAILFLRSAGHVFKNSIEIYVSHYKQSNQTSDSTCQHTHQ